MKNVLNLGEVELVNWTGSDLGIINAARASFGKQVSEIGDKDIRLLERLIREGHLSTTEHTLLTFRVKAPIFVVRQWHRHRIGWSYNERSGRYCEPEFDFYVPDNLKRCTNYTKKAFGEYYEYIVEMYKNVMTYDNIPREVARALLPQGLYTNFTCTCNLRSFLNFYNLRSTEHAQKEIRVYAEAMMELIKEIPEKPFKYSLHFINGGTMLTLPEAF